MNLIADLLESDGAVLSDTLEFPAIAAPLADDGRRSAIRVRMEGSVLGGIAMRAMVVDGPGRGLRAVERPSPVPGPGEVRLRVLTCGVCRTDLHLLDGELPQASYPRIPGHQIVGVVEAAGERVAHLTPGARVGVPWLGWTCGCCRFCLSGRENLCPEARFTGCMRDGGFAEEVTADARFCFPIPEGYPDLQAAPLLCAGLIGYRSLRMAGDPASLGLFGFGAAAHIVIQVARAEGRRVFAFTRGGDTEGQAFARTLGAEWAGGAEESPGEPLDAAIVFAPAGELVPIALRAVDRGGTVVCAGIHMSDIPSFPYRILWEERTVRSVANLTRRDGHAFLKLAPHLAVATQAEAFSLDDASEALDRLRRGHIRGAAVLKIG